MRKTWKRSLALAGLVAATALSPVSLAADKKKSRVAAQAVLAGSVFQESGFLVRGARVVVTNAGRPREKKETATDLQGEFAVRVPAGKARYTVEVAAEGFLPQQKTVEVSGDERIDLTFRLATRPAP